MKLQAACRIHSSGESPPMRGRGLKPSKVFKLLNLSSRPPCGGVD